jgi:hypothetical protein
MNKDERDMFRAAVLIHGQLASGCKPFWHTAFNPYPSHRVIPSDRRSTSRVELAVIET